MAHPYQIIDIDNWKRKEHYQVFMNAVQPKYCVGVELDVTHFRAHIKAKSWPFTMAFIFAVSKCANEIEEFRYRFVDGRVVLYESIDTSFTYLNTQTELFKVVNVPMQKSIDQYVVLAKSMADDQQEYFTGPLENDIYIFSALPWITFTHISHTDFGNKQSAQPVFDWGKYYEKEGKHMMPFAVHVHHAFVDGLHIAKLADRLQCYLDEI